MSTHESPRPGVLDVEDATGLWRVVSADGRAVCLIALDRFAREVGGYGAHVEACVDPALAAVTGWRPIEGGFELMGPAGKAVAAFRRRGVDAFGAVEGDYRLERAPLA